MPQRSIQEEEIYLLHQEGQWRSAFEKAIRLYTPWLRAWLRNRVQEEQTAKDIFQEICLRVWRGFPAFRWGSSLKTWLCVVALHEVQRRPLKNVAETFDSSASLGLNNEVSSLGTRLEKKLRLDRLFAQFSEEERHLLLLRQLSSDASWEELAASQDPERVLSEGELKKESARLRQRFHRLVERLKEAAQDDPFLSEWLEEVR